MSTAYSTNRTDRWLKYWQVGGRPILILGHGRSGTTWVGNVLARARRTLYYFEPASPLVSGLGGAETWFRYLPPGASDPQFERIFDPVFQGLRPQKRGWRRASWHRLMPGYRIVVKDVAALMSVAWLAARYQPHVVILVRHPCATVLSEIKQGVSPNESKALILAQKDLIRDHLTPYLPVLERASAPLETFAAIWAARYRVVENLHQVHPDWQFVFYEDLCLDPHQEFRKIFERVGLGWSEAVSAYVEHSSSAEQGGMYSGMRVSREQVDKWRRQLTTDEIAGVRAAVRPFNLPFYQDPSNWI